jgi:hypothetical protein
MQFMHRADSSVLAVPRVTQRYRQEQTARARGDHGRVWLLCGPRNCRDIHDCRRYPKCCDTFCSTESPVQWIWGEGDPGIKRSEREADRLTAYLLLVLVQLTAPLRLMILQLTAHLRLVLVQLIARPPTSV